MKYVSQTFIDIQRRDSVISLKDNDLELGSDVSSRAENTYGDAKNLGLVNLEPSTFFSDYNLPFSTGEQSETSTNAHIICFLYNLLTNGKHRDDSSIGLHHSAAEKLIEFLDYKHVNTRGKVYVRISSINVFGFAEHQKKATFGLGYILTMEGNNANLSVHALAGDADVAIFLYVTLVGICRIILPIF